MKVEASGAVALHYDGTRLTSEGKAVARRDGSTLRVTGGGGGTIVMGSGVSFGNRGVQLTGATNFFCGVSGVTINGMSPDHFMEEQRREAEAPGAAVDEAVPGIDELVLSGVAAFHWKDPGRAQPRLSASCSGQSELRLAVGKVDNLTLRASGQASINVRHCTCKAPAGPRGGVRKPARRAGGRG